MHMHTPFNSRSFPCARQSVSERLLRWAIAVLLAAWLGCLCSGTAGATQPGRPMDRPQLQAFVDGIVEGRMRDRRIAGATVAVVTAGDSLVLSAYGTAHPGTPGQADPAASMFRVGSVSKVFTYLAVMQLAGRGKLDVEADANAYLPAALRIPAQGYGPVKVWHLMTHTAGFEDSAAAALRFQHAAVMPSLHDYLAGHRPRRVRAPGVHSAYSNYSTALLGAMVAHLSGQSYESYVEANLFVPLNMLHTSCREPLPPADERAISPRLAASLALPLAYVDGAFVSQPAQALAWIAPAGACSSSAADMARFMRMLLNRGSLDGVEIVPAADFARYTAIRFREAHSRSADGLAYGLFRSPYGKYLSLEHAGDTLHFHAKFSVLPQAGIGVFVAVNSDSGASLTRDLPDLVLRRFVPAAEPAAGLGRQCAAADIAGIYMPLRRNFSTVEKIAGIAGAVQVQVGADGAARIGADRWEQLGTGDFLKADGAAAEVRLRFVRDRHGAVVGMATGTRYWERAGWLDDYRVLAAMLVASLLAMTAALARFWRRRGAVRGLRRRLHEAGVRHSLALAAAIALSGLALLALLLFVLARMPSTGASLAPAYADVALWCAAILAHLAAALVLGLGLLLYQVPALSGWTRARKARHGAVVLCLCGAVALLARWNLLGAPLI